MPRPETELLAGWAIERPRRRCGAPVVVDLCTGSGAIAKAVATRCPAARVHAVELDEAAYAWAGATWPAPASTCATVTSRPPSTTCVGQVDVVVCNPPYIPLEAWESVAPEARDHDPHLALFSGRRRPGRDPGAGRAGGELLRPGGVVGVEHADVQGESVPAVFAAAGPWTEVRDHRDLTGRARFTTARLAR